MPDKPPPMNRYLLANDGLSFWNILFGIAIVLLLVQIYAGIGIGLLYAGNDSYNQRCGQNERVTGAMIVASAVVWPAIAVSAGVWRLLGGTQQPCPVR